ncbi:HNH endonuclease [Brevibacillus parabrevis]|uniref:HNH endonuclease n=1 Tax=Brevibacillus parabrevis TaxID=54914 RepID=UPI001C217047|nr:HNH endonuclease [Brevibacillus parabrevis]MBU8715430.1 HNH endonuclease [Brevibacillus parabrevis]
MEIWQDVRGFEGHYQVSSLGRIRSLTRVVQKRAGGHFTVRGRLKKTYVNNSGYECVDLDKEGRTHKTTVHRLVASHFCTKPDDATEVHHIDGDRLNNRANNLQWVTRQENVQETIQRGTHNVEAAHRIAWEKNKKPVEMLTLDGKFIREFPSITDAVKETGALQSKISLVCNGHRSTTHGFRWRFKQCEGSEIV